MTSSRYFQNTRLTLIEYKAILDAVLSVVPADQLQAIFLFGSRMDTDKKGGDIDLWVECNEGDDTVFRSYTRNIRSKLMISLGEQKIDIVLTKSAEEEPDPHKKAFLNVIGTNKIILWQKQI